MAKTARTRVVFACLLACSIPPPGGCFLVGVGVWGPGRPIENKVHTVRYTTPGVKSRGLQKPMKLLLKMFEIEF